MSAPLKVGDRVQMTPEGLRLNGRGIGLRGVVVSIQPDRETVRIKREGMKALQTWHWQFWQLEDGEGETA